MKVFIKNNWQILLLEIFTIIIFTIFYGSFGDIMVDSFREAYIPQQILKGKNLYKDIFVIYPPLSYLINAFFMKIFGTGLKTLYFAGLFSTLGILFFTYKIAERFLNKIFSTGICLFLIAGLVLSPNVFNTFFPYSYGITYGLLFSLLTIHFSFYKKIPLAYLFYSLAILCKYEFILLLPVLVIFTKKTDLLKNLLAFVCPIILTMLVLTIQGVKIDDLKTGFELINIISNTKTLYWFYSVMGLTFRFELIPIYISSFINFFIPPMKLCKYQESLIWVLPSILPLLFFRFKHLNKYEKIFILATLLVSLKVFFALTIQSYGVYFLPFTLISLFIITPIRFRKILFIFIMIWAFIIGFNNTKALAGKVFKIDKIVQYVKTTTAPNDKVVVYPECLAINVLSQRESDDKFYSLIPLYVETFGENVITKRLEITKPNYIFINNYDTSAYYYKEFGVDYAKQIQEWIEKNYTLQKTINDGWNFKVYKSN